MASEARHEAASAACAPLWREDEKWRSLEYLQLENERLRSALTDQHARARQAEAEADELRAATANLQLENEQLLRGFARQRAKREQAEELARRFLAQRVAAHDDLRRENVRSPAARPVLYESPIRT